MLHAINAEGVPLGKRWCGPGAVSALTGVPLKDTTAKLSFIAGQRYDEAKEFWTEDVILALNDLGYRANEINLRGRYPKLRAGPTLHRFFAERSAYETAMPMLVVLHKHFLTAHWGYACDNWTMRPVHISDFPKLNRFVTHAFIISPKKGT